MPPLPNPDLLPYSPPNRLPRSTFRFKVSKVCAVQYRLDQFNGTSVFNGIYPVFDPSLVASVSISRTCSGALLSEPSYTLWYWATDVYGKSSPPVASSVVL